VAKHLPNSAARAISGAVDQVFSSLSSGLIIYAVAVVTATDDFGEIALLLTLLSAAIGALRGALGTPLLLTAGRDASDIRREGSYAFTSALLVSPIVGAVMWAVGGAGIGLPAILIIVATPIVLAEDVLRFVAIAQGRPHVAALWDGVWFAGSAALLVATWLRLPLATTTNILAVWTALALIALVGMVVGVRVGPRVRNYVAWMSDGWQHRLRYGADYGLEQTAVFGVLLFASLVLSPYVSATLRGATALLAPIAIATSAIPLVVIPESRRQNMAPQRVWNALARITLVSSSATVLFGIALFLLPNKVGELLLGGTFADARSIIPIVGLEYAIVVWPISVIFYLRAFNRSADALTLKLCYALVLPVMAFGGGLLFHTAAGVVVGMASAATFNAAYSLIRIKPWKAPQGPSGDQQSAEPDPLPSSASGRVSPEAGERPLKVVAASPMPLATRLRLHQPTQLGEPLITLWTFGVMGVLVPAVIIRFTGTPDGLTWMWPLPAIVIAAARLSWLVGKGDRRLFEMIFWVYSYAFMGLAPLAQLRQDHWPITVPRVDATLVGVATLMVLLGFAAFIAGAGLDSATSLQRPKLGPKRTEAIGSQLFTISYRRTVLLAGFAILIALYYLSNVGWFQFLLGRAEAREHYDAVWPVGSPGVVVLPCTYMALLVAFIALVRFRQEVKTARLRGANIPPAFTRGNMLLIIVVALLLADVMNPISTARYHTGTAIFGAATAFGLFATKRRFRVFTCSMIAAMLAIFPFTDAFRTTLKASFKAANPVDSLLSGDYDSFAQLMNGYLVGTREGIIVGRQFSGVLLFWLRRVWWEDKPVDTGVHIANVRGYGFTNLSAPLWIELYLNGGWVLLVVGMFGLGYGLHRWDTRLEAQIQVARIPGPVGCILPFYMLILLRGSLLQASAFLFFILTFSFFVAQRNKTKTRPGALQVLPQPPPTRVEPRAAYVAS
jgi:hypothetical protein